jgi:hypothetical protein
MGNQEIHGSQMGQSSGGFDSLSAGSTKTGESLAYAEVPTKIVGRRQGFGVPARSYEMLVETDIQKRDLISLVHTWAVTKGYEFGGAVSERANVGYRLFGEFPPNKFTQDSDTPSIAADLAMYLRSRGGINGVTNTPVTDLMELGQARGVIGTKPGYGDAVALDLEVARALADKVGSVCEFEPVTIFYNYEDKNSSDGYAKCDEPGVSVRFAVAAGKQIDEAVEYLCNGLKQTSIHLVVGAGTDNPSTHEAWKVTGERTAREVAKE